MILQRLVEFSGRTDTTPPMYQKTRVKWLIDIEPDGTPVGIGIVPLTGGAVKGKDRGKEMVVPHIGRTVKIAAKLLADNAEYVLGIGDDPKTPARHAAFCELVDRCSEKTGDTSVKAVQAFLRTCKDKGAILPEQAEDGDILTFRVEGRLPIELPAVQGFWAQDTLGGDKVMQCLVCGEVRPVEERLPLKIKGVPGGQMSGIAMISANSEAFESYGLEASLVAPTCRNCAEAFTNSINYMMSSENHRLRVGPTAFLFWTREETDFNPALLLSRPEEEDVRVLLESYRTGRYSDQTVKPEEFYALTLSASGSRAVVRDWLDTTVPQVQANLGRWFQLQNMLDSDGKPGRPFGVFALAACLYLKPNDQMVANVPRALVRCALYGGMLPDWILAQAVSRARAEKEDRSRGREKVSRSRAALIKAVLLSQMNDYKEDYMEKLDMASASQGYLCGRLLAELEAAQKAAINPKATIVDRYYGAASSAPATVFGNLMRGSRAHMSTLNRDKHGAFVKIDKNIQEILSGLQEFPKTLNLKEQAMFALGYYHQKAARWAKAEVTETTDMEEAE